MEQKIKFKDLSTWLKTAVVFIWIVGGYLALSVLIGVILAMFDVGV